jgi:hypothetical protein
MGPRGGDSCAYIGQTRGTTLKHLLYLSARVSQPCASALRSKGTLPTNDIMLASIKARRPGHTPRAAPSAAQGLSGPLP